MNKEKTKNKNTKILVSGFTLVELMVATTLFTIIMLMGVGSLIVSSNSAKAAQRLRIAVDNVNFAMESMTRELRTGSYYYCPPGIGTVSIPAENSVSDCPSGRDVIIFKPQQVGSSTPAIVGYFKSPRNDANSTSTLERCETNASNCHPIVADNVDIELLKFTVLGSSLPSSSTDKTQPSVRILMKGSVNVNGQKTPFTLQSMASQRSTEE